MTLDFFNNVSVVLNQEKLSIIFKRVQKQQQKKNLYGPITGVSLIQMCRERGLGRRKYIPCSSQRNFNWEQMQQTGSAEASSPPLELMSGT